MSDKGTISNPIAATVPTVPADDLSAFVAVPVTGGAMESLADVVAQGIGGETLTFDSADVEDQMVLSLSDLLPDQRGDVVLMSEAGPLSVNIMTDSRVTETGTAENYVTSAGVDVTGYHFCTFEAGLTIYYPPGIDLLVTVDHA
jgi:hypothetical protein